MIEQNGIHREQLLKQLPITYILYTYCNNGQNLHASKYNMHIDVHTGFYTALYQSMTFCSYRKLHSGSVGNHNASNG